MENSRIIQSFREQLPPLESADSELAKITQAAFVLGAAQVIQNFLDARAAGVPLSSVLLSEMIDVTGALSRTFPRKETTDAEKSS